MSDAMDTGASAPTSTDLAAQVVESAEQAPDAGAQTTPDSGEATAIAEVAAPTTTTEAPTTETPTVAEVAAAVKFLQKQGHNPTNTRGGNTYLPFHTVEKMLDRYASERMAEHEGKYSSLDTEHQALRKQWDELSPLGELMERDPRGFLELVAQHDERYRSFLAPPAAAAAPVATGMPDPDVDLGNGTRTYSPDGIVKLIQWASRQEIDQRLKPIEDRAKTEEQRAQEQRVAEQLEQRVGKQMQEAKAWPAWAEYESDVLAALQKDSAAAKAANRRPTMTLREAYLEVKASRMETDHGKVRDRVLAELKLAPKSTAIGRQPTDAPSKTGPKSSADIVRAVVSQMEQAS
jgi:hypothetical protein